MFNLKYLWAWSDSLVYRKWETNRVLKFYTVKDIPEKITTERIRLYHNLQNSNSNISFDLKIDNWCEKLWILLELVRTITFEILYLDTDYIWFASGLNWMKLDLWLVVSEVDYVPWQTLEEKWVMLLWENVTRNISKLVTKKIATIYENNQIWALLSYYLSKEIYINPSNYKCKISWDNLHLIITDTMNYIWILKT